MSDTVKVLFLTTGGLTQASTRFRVLQFLPYFEQMEEIEVLDVVVLNSQMSPPDFIRCLGRLLRMSFVADVLVIQKARLPVLLTLGLGKLCKLVYDFDDAVFLPPPSWPEEREFSRKRRRFEQSLPHMHVVVAGNTYLAEHARLYSKAVRVVPTVVDTGQIEVEASAQWSPRQIFVPGTEPKNDYPTSDSVVLGWIGGSEHAIQLDAIGEVLEKMQQKYRVKVKVVSGRNWEFPGLRVVNKDWALEEEVRDVQSFDIGLMPLESENPFLKGKCGFKAIECMAVGIPVVASPVGVNTDLIDHGVNGFLARNPQEWEAHLELLIQDPDLRRRIGSEGRDSVIRRFSVASVLPDYVDLFQSLRQNS